MWNGQSRHGKKFCSLLRKEFNYKIIIVIYISLNMILNRYCISYPIIYQVLVILTRKFIWQYLWHHHCYIQGCSKFLKGACLYLSSEWSSWGRSWYTLLLFLLYNIKWIIIYPFRNCWTSISTADDKNPVRRTMGAYVAIMFIGDTEQTEDDSVCPVWPASWEIAHRLTLNGRPCRKWIAVKSTHVTVPLEI